MKKTGLYGYYDTVNKYVVYIGKDSDVGNNKRYKDHKMPSKYNDQVINKVVQKNPKRYTYFRFIEGEYDDETLNELEREAIRLFKTYKYDYPDRSVFNFTRGGDGVCAEGQYNPNWRKENYAVIKSGIVNGKQTYRILGRYCNIIKTSINKERLEQLTNKLNNNKITEEEVKNLQLYDKKGPNSPNWKKEDYTVVKGGISRGKQQYIILGRYNKVIKRSVNKKQLDELTNKLNNKEISEKEVKNLRLYDAKERAKNAIQSRIKYNMWNPSCCCYYKTKMLQYNGGDKPKKCFALRHKGKMVPIGFFNEFTSCEIIDSIVKEAVKNEK